VPDAAPRQAGADVIAGARRSGGDPPPPEGQLFHAAGASEGGWTILAVHESKASWEKFRDGILTPRMQAGIEGGFTAPPQETEIDVYRVQP